MTGGEEVASTSPAAGGVEGAAPQAVGDRGPEPGRSSVSGLFQSGLVLLPGAHVAGGDEEARVCGSMCKRVTVTLTAIHSPVVRRAQVVAVLGVEDRRVLAGLAQAFHPAPAAEAEQICRGQKQ